MSTDGPSQSVPGVPRAPRGPAKAPMAYRTISEVAQELDVPQHVLRFWEGKFPQIRPLKRAGGRRYYRPDDVVLLVRIRTLLYAEGYTIKGVQRLLNEGGARMGAGKSAGLPAHPGLFDSPDLSLSPDVSLPTDTATRQEDLAEDSWADVPPTSLVSPPAEGADADGNSSHDPVPRRDERLRALLGELRALRHLAGEL